MAPQKTLLHKFFLAMVIIKGIDGVFDLVASVVLGVISFPLRNNFMYFLVQNDQAEDPREFIAHYLYVFSHHLTFDTQRFIIIYLIIHGLIKVGLFAAFLSKKTWAYKVAGTTLTLFLVYQSQRFLHTHSMVLLCFIFFDVLMLYLMYRDHEMLVKRNSLHQSVGQQ